MKNIPVLQEFLNELIDYAGLFPPAKLELSRAIQNYSNYISSEHSWMLGPFVIPATILNRLQLYKNFFKNKRLLRLSVTGTKGISSKNVIQCLKEDYRNIREFLIQNSTWSKIEKLEIPLPPEKPSKALLEKILSISQEINSDVFCEIPLVNLNNWKENLLETLDVIADFNSVNEVSIGVKLRTGGIKAELIPKPEQVAKAIALSRDRELRMKFTAGLHYPVRMFRNEVKTEMHGFLNVFMAGMLAYKFNFDEAQIEKILKDEYVNHFQIGKNRLSWQNYILFTDDIKRFRKKLCSFGSCNFNEPKDELEQIVKKQEAIR